MIKIIAIGRVKETAMQAILDEYAKRMKSEHPIKVIELNNSNKNEEALIVEDESKRILANIDSKDFVMLLDLRGKDMDSVALSERIEEVLSTSKDLVFVIGGSYGVSEEVRTRSNYMWRLSKLTFPHQLVRILLFEQIYRAFMIKKKHPYHK